MQARPAPQTTAPDRQVQGVEGAGLERSGAQDGGSAAQSGDWMQACLAAMPCMGGDPGAGKVAVGHLVRTIEQEVIPRLAQAHRANGAGSEPVSAVASPNDVQSFVARILQGSEADVLGLVEHLRRRGLTVQSIYLELLAPAARVLGALWDRDLCDFPSVTVALGRLQRLLRELSPDFSRGAGTPRHAHRILLAQPPYEQHSFGLSMVAEFFRRDGWIVEGGVGTASVDPAARVQVDCFDVVGFSLGSQTRLEWLRQKIAAVRLVSRNPALVVMVGGPLITLYPEWTAQVGADASAHDASDAPRQAARLVAEAVAALSLPLRSDHG